MVGNIDSLPEEIWIDISQFLDVQDLFRLRLCSKRLNSNAGSRAIWKPRCQQKWLIHQGHDLLNDDLEPTGDDWFYYFRYRNRIDCHLIKQLRQINNECDDTKYWNFYKRVLRYKPPHIIPLLHRIVSKEYLESDMPFDMITLCQHLLISFRHKHIYDLFTTGEELSQFVHDAEATFFLPLSAMDPSFDRLLCHRKQVFERIHALVKQEFHGALEGFLRLPATLRVDKLICYLLLVLDTCKSDENMFLEDFMILRVYAGETSGHPLLLLSIIQALASIYDVETVLCGSYLIIHDSKLKYGEAYLTISSIGRPKIFTRRKLIQSLKHIVGPSDYIIQNEILPSILQPLKYRELLSTVFKELLPLYCKSKWCTATSKTIAAAKCMFPFSNQPMTTDIVNYFLCVYKAVDIHFRSQLRISSLYTITHKEVFSLVSRLYPADSMYAKRLLKCNGTDFGETTFTYEDWLFKLHNISLESSEELGLFVISPRDHQLMCVVGTKMLNEGCSYYTLMNFLGEFYVELRQNVVKYEWGSNGTSVNDFLSLASQSDLGLMFSGIDPISHKLTVNSKIEDIIYKKNK